MSGTSVRSCHPNRFEVGSAVLPGQKIKNKYQINLWKEHFRGSNFRKSNLEGIFCGEISLKVHLFFYKNRIYKQPLSSFTKIPKVGLLIKKISVENNQIA